MKTYAIEKIDFETQETVADYGRGFTEEDVKDITKGYKKTEQIGNWTFYQRKNCRVGYIAIEQ